MVSRWLRRTGRERGAVMVEMAVILPLLLLLVIGAIEFGLLFHERLTIASAASSAARTGATMGIRDEADYAILQALEAGLYDQVDTSVIIRVDIFKADPITGQKTGNYDRYLYQPLGDDVQVVAVSGRRRGWPRGNVGAVIAGHNAR